MPTCPICNKEMKYINNSHLKSHGLTPTQFKEQFPEVDAIPQEIREANKRNSKIAVQNSIKTGLKNLQKRIDEYNKNPKKCKNCGRDMDYEKRKNKFCSHNCAAIISNKNREFKYSEAGLKSLRECAAKIFSIVKPRKKKVCTPYDNICEICKKIFQIKWISKKKKTCSEKCLKKYQSMNNHRKNNTKTKFGYYNGTYCASSLELAFLIYNLDLGRDIKRCDLTFKYELEGEEHLYFPDFTINGTIYEVKGRELKDVEFKTKAVIDSGYTIHIIRKKEINPIIKSIKEKYGVRDITQLYDKKN